MSAGHSDLSKRGPPYLHKIGMDRPQQLRMPDDEGLGNQDKEVFI
jgi:hypothetical protein